jgi:hypothetical protein
MRVVVMPPLSGVVPELERVRNLCYQSGKECLSRDPESQALYSRLLEECPHVPSRDLVLLFHLGDPELTKAAAHRLEYNATHPRWPR